jgi:hypothetical protein
MLLLALAALSFCRAGAFLRASLILSAACLKASFWPTLHVQLNGSLCCVGEFSLRAEDTTLKLTR